MYQNDMYIRISKTYVSKICVAQYVYHMDGDGYFYGALTSMPFIYSISCHAVHVTIAL